MTTTEATTSADAAGWSRVSEGLVWGQGGRERLRTMLRILALHSPDEQHLFAEPEPPADHEHAGPDAEPCSCQAIWMSGDMPPPDELPRRPGVYICYDQNRDPAYIGTSRSNVRARLLAHHRDPAKPALSSWLGFWPSEFSDPAAMWEIRLINRERPYLNRQHAEGVEPVRWEPKPARPPHEPWYRKDPHYQWFMEGPGSLLRMGDVTPWQVARLVRDLFADGATEADIWEACDITLGKSPENDVPYLAAVVRHRLAEREQA